MEDEVPDISGTMEGASFEQIAADAIVRAETVDCDMETFVAGMKVIYCAIQERYEAARSEVGL